MVTRVVALVFIPTLAALFGLFWFRRKKRPPCISDDSQSESNRSHDLGTDSTVSGKIDISNSFGDKPAAELPNDTIEVPTTKPDGAAVVEETCCRVFASPQKRVSNRNSKKQQPTRKLQISGDAVPQTNGLEQDITDVAVDELVAPPINAEELNSSSVCHQMVAQSSNEADLDNESVSQPGSPNVEAEVSEVTSRAAANGHAASSGSTTPSVDSPIEKSSLSGSNGFSSDAHSEVSADSGRGSLVDGVVNEGNTTPKQKLKQRQSSPQQQTSVPSSGGRPTRRRNHIVYEFDFPSELCGRLIGRNGKNINILKDRSGVEITIKRKPYTKELQVVCLEGTQKQIDAALEQIQKRFPPSQFPQINFTAINSAGVECPVLPPEVMQLSLPESVTIDVIVSSVVTPNHIFVQQPTHAMYPLLDRQNQCMLLCYNQDGIVPQLPRPLEVGVICVAPMFRGWYRAQIVQTYPDTDECDIKFVDFGGYMSVHGSILRQIRSDFTTLPFQAVECYLANLAPPQDMETFQPEAAAVLEELVHGQPLQLEVTAHEEDGVPYINLFLISRDQIIFVNRELVNKGVARWLEA